MNAMPEPQEPETAAGGDVALTPHEWQYRWQAAFLIALCRTGNVSQSARAAEVSLSWVKEVKQSDPVFREAWDEAIEIGADLLEQIAHRRATVGEPRRITRTKRKLDTEGRVVEEETVVEESIQISNALLITLLKARRPEQYRERYDHRHTVPPPPPADVDPVYRWPTNERMLELARLARELELPPGPPDVNGTAYRVEPAPPPGEGADE